MSDEESTAAKSAVSGFPPRVRLEVSRGSRSEFETWRWAVAPMFEIRAEDPETYRMSSSTWFLGPLALGAAASSAMRLQRSNRAIARSGVDDVLVQIYREGRYRLETDCGEIDVAAGDVAVIDLSRSTTISSTDYRNLTMVMRRSALEGQNIGVDALHGRILRRGEALNAVLSSHLQTLQMQISRMAPDEARSINQATASLVAACFGSSMDRREQGKGALSAASLRIARRAIEGRLKDVALGPDALSRMLGISRTRLYKMFEPLGGVHRYIQRRRLARAFAEIEAADEKIGVIAARWGFANIATFNRLFRDAYGMAPRDMRAAAQSLSPSNLGSRSADADAEFVNTWLLGLDSTGR